TLVVVSDFDVSIHWYISALRVRRTPVATIPNSLSRSCAFVSTGPLICTSAPSRPASTEPTPTDCTRPAPSARERAVCTARPSFQNSRTTIPTMRSSPKTTPPNDRLIRPNHETDVVSRYDMALPPDALDA